MEVHGSSSLETGTPVVDSVAVKSFATATLSTPLQKFASLTVFMRIHILTAFVVTTLCFLSLLELLILLTFSLALCRRHGQCHHCVVVDLSLLSLRFGMNVN